MTGRAKILRELEELPQDALKDVAKFITSLKRRQGRKLAADRNGQMLAKRQLSAIKKWAGTNLEAGFPGRDHDTALYGEHR